MICPGHSNQMGEAKIRTQVFYHSNPCSFHYLTVPPVWKQTTKKWIKNHALDLVNIICGIIYNILMHTNQTKTLFMLLQIYSWSLNSRPSPTFVFLTWLLSEKRESSPLFIYFSQYNILTDHIP